jgi:hypothetical protein
LRLRHLGRRLTRFSHECSDFAAATAGAADLRQAV